MEFARRAVAGLGLLAVCAMGAQAQTLVSGACTPSSFSFGVITAPETSASVACAPTGNFVFPDNRVEPYTVTFDFQLAQPADFLVNVQGSYYLPNPLQPFHAGIGISAQLFYEGTFLTAGFGRGIGDAEGPALLNPDFALNVPGFGPGTAEPAGTYQIRVTGTSFGPRPDGFISARISADIDPVTPVPEPMTMALQAVGAGLLAAVLMRRRRSGQAAATAQAA